MIVSGKLRCSASHETHARQVKGRDLIMKNNQVQSLFDDDE